ncbi:unnamed protein product, partial [Prorocentrum cordatum]
AEQRGCAGGPRPAEGRVRLPAGPARWQAVPGWPRQAAAPRVPPWPLRRARGWRGRGPRQHGVAGAREARCGPGRRASRREAAQRPSGCRAGPCPALPCRLHARDVGEPRSRDGDGGTSYGPGQAVLGEGRDARRLLQAVAHAHRRPGTPTPCTAELRRAQKAGGTGFKEKVAHHTSREGPPR